MHEPDRAIEGEISTPSVVAQLYNTRHPSPIELIVREERHTVALQRQRLQDWSSGRYCPGGPGTFQGAGRFADVGRVLVVPADVPLHVRAAGGPVRVVRCRFSEQSYHRFTGRSLTAEAQDLAACLDVRSPSIAATLARLEAEIQSPGFASETLTEALGVSLMVDLARYLGQAPGRPPLRGGLSPRQVRLITEFVEGAADWRGAAPSLTQLSQLTGVSVRHLSRAFKQTTGQTVHDYVEQVRFDKAAGLLAGSDLMMKDIAHRLGFRSSSSFTVAFQRSSGETPQAYRRRVRGR